MITPSLRACKVAGETSSMCRHQLVEHCYSRIPQGLLVHGDGDRCIFHPRQRGEQALPRSVPYGCCGADTCAFQFYCEAHTPIGENYARFAFCKDVDTLKHAVERLQKLKQFLA